MFYSGQCSETCTDFQSGLPGGGSDNYKCCSINLCNISTNIYPSKALIKFLWIFTIFKFISN